MAIKLVALYRKPDDVDAILRYYEDVHVSLVRKTHTSIAWKSAG